MITDSWKLRNGSSWNSPADFFSSYQYDANGNILTLTRNGCTAGGWGHIDSLTYQYANPGVTNLLDHVDDKIAAGVSLNDLDDQAGANYAYDANGNMTGDVQEGITAIKWTSYGKVERVVKGVTQQRFKYDASGQRIKVVLDNEDGSSGYYIREAGGKVLARYIKAGVDRDDYESVTDGCIHTNGSGEPYDSDQDGVPDDKDNAPNFPNPDQGDADGDGTADVLDTDIDNDGIGNFTDVCPFDPLNSCAGDHDSDGIPDSLDPCPQYPGYPGDDTDHDGIPDNCDGDLDGDGIPNHEDNCVHVYNPDQADADTNGIGDACQCLSGNGGGGTSVADVRIGMFYVYGNGGESMVAEVDPFFGDLGERDTVAHTDTIFTRRLRFKRYDLKDHGGSTREQYSDLKLDDNHQGAGPYVIDYQFHASYYPFGMLQEGRSNPQVAGDYLYNGKEDDRTWNNGKNTGTGGGNSYDFGARIYNPRLGRWLSGEPLAPMFPGLSPMAYAANSPIALGDPDGKKFKLLFPACAPEWQKTAITKAFAELVYDLSPYSVELMDLANSEIEFTIVINTQQDNHFGGIMGEGALGEFRYIYWDPYLYHNGQYGGGAAQSLLHEMMHMYYYNDPNEQMVSSGPEGFTAWHWTNLRMNNDFNYLHIPLSVIPDFASAFGYIISPYGCLNFEELHATYRLGLVIQNIPEAIRRKYGLVDPEFHYSLGVGETRYGSWPNGREDYCVGTEDPGRIETMVNWQTWGDAYPNNPEMYPSEAKDLIMPIDAQDPGPSNSDYRYPSPPNAY